MNLRFLRLPYFFLFLLIFSSSNVFSQCFEIQSILVDACGPLEGRNEMVRFKVGNASLNINDLAVIWPNNSWQGIVQNSTTATVVAQLNADIVAAGGCGQILEPPGGILPANATAILVTSYLMVTNDNSFGPLSENIYMIFQNATTSTGHFANQSILPPNNRTLVMNFVGSCSDTVIYDKSQLIDINGNKAPGDGATVNYTPDGTASYTNNGCKAPVPPFTVDAGPATLTACAGSTITLNGTAVGQQSVAWSSSSGNFSSPTTTATNFTIPAGAGGTTIALTLQATNSCGLLISDVINLSVTTNITPDFATTMNLCSTDTAPTLATTSPNGITGTWNPAVINTTASANYIFTPNAGQCGTTASLAVTINSATIPDFATTLTLCSSDTAPTLALTSPNGITGTWNPAVISTTTSGNYTFTPTAGQCAAATTLAVTITPQTIPDFATILTLCSSDTAPTLALTSPNGITGTWNPAVINTTSGNYTFTPTAGQCATNTTLAVTITPQTIPDFATTLTLCSSDTAPTLALTSPNGITGTWSPNIIDTVTSGNYTFTPTAGQCASATTLAVTITPQTIPDFATALTLCSNDTAPTLALTSPNGITGTWSPNIIDTATSDNYTFTPTTGQCAATVTLAVTITPQTIPDFATNLTLCSSDTAPTLALTSPNGITGTWSPAIISTATSGNYTFTPTAGQCATNTTLAVTITPQIIPDFATTLTLCSSDTVPTLALTSPNEITGTWSPAIITTTTSGNYTFTPTAGQCAATTTLTVILTPQTIPDFATTLTLCSNDTAPSLALTSPNGITGTWSPSVISTTTSGNYTFTPNAGQCAAATTLAVTITPQTIPDFATTLTLCSSDTAPTLALTSPNGITGTWSPNIIDTVTSSNYTFTPTAGQCASATTLAVTITPQTIPDFATALTLCSNDTAPTLALTSPNGITGTWSPAIISTTTSSNYTFKPTAGQCAATVTLAVTITPQTIPDFATTLTLCSSDTAPTLALTSPNGITGTWNPAVISTTSGNYTFTPTAGQCAATTTLAVTVTPAIVPDFPATLNFCNGTPPVLQTTSPNGITGIWTTLTNNNSSYIFTPNPGQCATTATVQINFTSPAYTITKACVNNRYLIKVETTSSSNYSYTWVDDKGNPAGSNNETFDFSQYSENYNGELQFPLQFKVIVNDGSCEVEEVIEISNNLCGVPNAVSPNGDGINDTFDLTDFNVNTIAIYNRWGRKVYDFTGRYDKQWHGQWKEGNMLPTGTYYYIISSENGDQKAGYVFLSY
jgi:gliding motility-associated-like protein